MQIHFEITSSFYNLKIFLKIPKWVYNSFLVLQMLFKQYQMNMFNNVNTEYIQKTNYKVTTIQTTCLEFQVIEPVIQNKKVFILLK